MATLPRTFGVRSLLLVLATLGVFASRAWATSDPGGPDYSPPSPEAVVLQDLMLFFAIFIIAVTWLRGKEVISTLVTVRLLGVGLVVGLRPSEPALPRDEPQLNSLRTAITR
jgi:hypothetical protein